MVTKKRFSRDDLSGEQKFLAKVTTNPSLNSLFVKCPAIQDSSFHTGDVNSGHANEITAYKDVSEFTRNEYVYLVFRENSVGTHIIDAVEPASVHLPENYERINESDVPKVCPECGEKAIATMLKDDTKYDRVYSKDADICHISDVRASWYGIYENTVFIHG